MHGYILLCTYVLTYLYVYVYVHVGVNAIFVDVKYITDETVNIFCELSCFSPDLECLLHNLTVNDTTVNAKITTSNVTGSEMSYAYPNQTIIVNGLTRTTNYRYCVIGTNVTSKMTVGEFVCGNFTTIQCT